MIEPSTRTRIAVVGAGHVGATTAYTLLLSGLASEIVLVDADPARAEGEAMDIGHAAPLSHPTEIRAGALADCRGAAVTVIAAGAGQRPGESRLDLARRNAEVFREIVPRLAEANPEGILLVATNPVDVLARAAWQLSGLPAGRVIGSGTVLDTARFRSLLSKHFGVDPRSVHAFIIGEHGDSEVPVWSLANVAGMRMPAFCIAHGLRSDAALLDEIFRQTRDAAYEIIARKGATYFAVAAAITRIIEAILRDQSTVLPVSTRVQDYCGIEDTWLSVPGVVGVGGVERILRLELSAEEGEQLRASARKVDEALASLDLTPRGAAAPG
ncbi:MAG TPA: L-lactate dehydrogenase [Longimicrobiaceae bacterium]|nr:L-lactate dehydrogenase [Longimicrobiaceae bacterium]